jgi:mono/diheme cytochrome c family protein
LDRLLKREGKPQQGKNALLSTLLTFSLAVGGLTVMFAGCSVKTSPAPTNKALLSEPVVDKRYALEDFSFPSKKPSLMAGSKVYMTNCASCHAPNYWQQKQVQTHLAYTTPIDMYLFLTTGKRPEVVLPTPERLALLPDTHQKAPAFRNVLTRDDRWSAIFYVRYLAGFSQYSDLKNMKGEAIEMDSTFGGNCAVCHGNKGQADGFLNGKSSSHELASSSLHGGIFEPKPANFNEYKRMYNRTDAQLFKYLCEGIYPSAMPSWYGNVDHNKHFVYDRPMLTRLVRYVRHFSYENDMPIGTVAPKGIDLDTACNPVGSNKFWRESQYKVPVQFGAPGKPAPEQPSAQAEMHPQKPSAPSKPVSHKETQG